MNRALSPLVREQSDHDLVELHRGGLETAFELVVQRYRTALIGYCRRLVGQDHAEDIVQDTFATGYVALRRDTRPIQLKAWLYRIAHNRSLDLLRRKDSTYEKLDENFGTDTQPDEQFERKERVKVLIEQISSLPERQRGAIVLQELEGRSTDEVAVELGVGTAAVGQLIYRARQRLRKAELSLAA